MEVRLLEDKEFTINMCKEFAYGYLKAYDIFGILNKYGDVDASNSETYSYLDGFESVGNSFRKYIDEDDLI